MPPLWGTLVAMRTQALRQCSHGPRDVLTALQFREAEALEVLQGLLHVPGVPSAARRATGCPRRDHRTRGTRRAGPEVQAPKGPACCHGAAAPCLLREGLEGQEGRDEGLEVPESQKALEELACAEGHDMCMYSDS